MEESSEYSSALCSIGVVIMALKEDRGIIEVGDSGDELGEGSVIGGESNVEIVVVGEDPAESEHTETAVSRW